MYPREQVVASYQPVMPSFKGVIGEDDLVKLVAYIESLGSEQQP
jgi:cytochrome c oxidase subunit 2